MAPHEPVVICGKQDTPESFSDLEVAGRRFEQSPSDLVPSLSDELSPNDFCAGAEVVFGSPLAAVKKITQASLIRVPTNENEAYAIEQKKDEGSDDTRWLCAFAVCKRNKVRTYLAVRIVLRLAAVTCIALLVSMLHLNVSNWVETAAQSVETLGGPLVGGLLFTVCATLWCAFSPMGYLPAVITGMIFPFYLSPFLAYLSVFLGAILNTIWVRHFCVGSAVIGCILGSKQGRIAALESALKSKEALRIVILVRLPFLSNGVLNYLLSLSSVDFMTSVKGNAIGFIPGSALFALCGRQIRSILKLLYAPNSANSTEWIFTGVVAVVAAVCYVAVIVKVRAILKLHKELQQVEAVLDLSEETEDCSDSTAVQLDLAAIQSV